LLVCIIDPATARDYLQLWPQFHCGTVAAWQADRCFWVAPPCR